MLNSAIVETGTAALVFAAILVAGELLRLEHRGMRRTRTLVSFGAGMSVAYVFVHVMPELHHVRRAFAEASSVPLRYEGMAIYFLSLLGFLVFYGLRRLRIHQLGASGVEVPKSFRAHISVFGVYVCLTSYLLVHNIEAGETAKVLFAVAIGFHFLSLQHGLQEEFGTRYEQVGRFVLGGACVVGWGVGQLVEVPRDVLTMLMAFLSGAIIMNSMVVELPEETGGRFAPFATGSVLYGLVLLPLG